MTLNGAAIDVLQEEWRVFRKHHPAGAYYPIGQLDGDCHECGASWPCADARKVLDRAFQVQLAVLTGQRSDSSDDRPESRGVPINTPESAVGATWTGEYL